MPKGTAQEKQLLLASEKRRRRRESHNAVERRRRDNINEKISELATLIPECMLEGGSSEAPGPATMPLNGSPIENGNANTNGESGLTLTMDSPIASPTSPNLEEGGVDIWGDLNGVAKKESLDGLGLYPIGEDDSSNAPATTQPSQQTPNGTPTGNSGVKANKGMILRKSVEYIRYLQQLVTAQGARNRELEAELMRHRSQSNGEDVSGSSIGVGVGMGGAGMGMAIGMSGVSWASKPPPEGSDEQSGTSPSAGSTDPDDPPPRKKDEISRGRKRTTKFANGNGANGANGANSASASPPTNRTLRTRNGRGKAVTANGHAGHEDEDMSDPEDDERMEI